MPPKAASKVVNTSGWDARPWTRPGLGEEQVMEIKDAFDLFDKDRSGEITVGEMLDAMRSLGYDTEHGEAAEHVKVWT
jgi:Ca2+-binding EF-hand superfamily protein